MAVSAILKGARLPRLPARVRMARPPGRVAALAWALGVVALGAIVTSSMMSPGHGASALVTTGSAAAATAHPASSAPGAETLHNPADYRRPPPPIDGRPRVAIIVRGLGLSKMATAAAIADLPADITLGLSAYGRALQHDADAARADGHEIFLDMPVEPPGYPANDAGPQALLTSLSAAENAARMQWALERFTGFAGVILAPGSPALDSPELVTALLGEPGVQGLVWAHANGRGFAGARADIAAAALAVGSGASAHEIDSALERLEALARKNGVALAVVSPTPAMMARLKVWVSGLEGDGIALVPASALAVSPAS